MVARIAKGVLALDEEAGSIRPTAAPCTRCSLDSCRKVLLSSMFWAAGPLIRPALGRLVKGQSRSVRWLWTTDE